MKKQLIYILLPTDKASRLWIVTKDFTKDQSRIGKLVLGEEEWETKINTQAQHLYILSSDEIKEGDWFYSIAGFKNPLIEKATIDLSKAEHIKKIIATTNPELHTKCTKLPCEEHPNGLGIIGVAEISQSDIEHIIGLYNGINKEVDVEQLASDAMPDEAGYRGFIEGFNKCSELNADKKFTLEDMRNCYVAGSYVGKNPNEHFENFVQSLTKEQSKIDTVMVEYEMMNVMKQSKPKLKDGCVIIVRD